MNEPALNLKSSLPQWLDTLLAEGCSRDVFLREVSALCAVTPESPWETLALVDQYYRRGKLSTELFLAAKTRIERRVLGFQDAVVFLDRAVPAIAPAQAAAEPAALSTLVPEQEPGQVTNAPVDPELRVLRAELARTRKQAAVYRERLEALEWRRGAAAYLLGGPPASAPPVTDPAPRPDSDAKPWWLNSSLPLSKRQIASVALLAGALVLLPAMHGLSRPSKSVRAPVPVPAAQVANAPPPKPRLPGELQLADDRSVVYAGEAAATLTIRRRGGTSGKVGLEWWTAGLGARAGQDYVARGHQTLTMPDGQDSAQLQVPILPNPNRRHTEMFAVYIGKPRGGASLGAADQATVFILPPENTKRARTR